MIAEVKQYVVFGGETDVKERYVKPCLVVNPPKDSKVMVEEIFGPILPIVTYTDFNEEVVNYINKNEKPLALYYFGSNENHKKILESHTSSGAYVTNDCVV